MALLQIRRNSTFRRLGAGILLLSVCTSLFMYNVRFDKTTFINLRKVVLLNHTLNTHDTANEHVPQMRVQFMQTESNEKKPMGNDGDAQITSLIDIPSNFNFSHAHERQIKYTILWYNPAHWIQRLSKYVHLEKCQYDNCYVTEDKRILNTSAAVIYGINMLNMPKSPPVSQRDRDPNQIWIYLAREPPVLHRYNFNLTAWDNTMNWSISFNLDSDVTFPYGMFRTREQPYSNEPDYDKIYETKTKMAVWVVSNCRSRSRREEFVAALKKTGLQVDTFGRCGDHGKRVTESIENLVKPYKFYLSFENSFCHYYVTEKVTERYNDDVIMLIRGGADYRRLIPNDTYVDASRFQNVTSLAKYLYDLGANKTRYVEMLRNKYRYQAVGGEFTYPRAICEICRKLNTNGVSRKTIFRPKEHNLEEGRCLNKEDIEIK